MPSKELRMPDTNVVVFAGRLTRDAEYRTVGDNQLTKLSCANTRHYKKKNGDKAEDSVFVEVAVWGMAAEWNRGLKKGDPVEVIGRLSFDEWETQSGERRTRVGINADRVSQLTWSDRTASPVAGNAANRGNQEPEESDDLPF